MAPSANLRKILLIGGAVVGAASAAAGAAVAYRRLNGTSGPLSPLAPSSPANEAARTGLEWASAGEEARLTVTTPDGAELAVWDTGGTAPPAAGAGASTVVLPHCWGCSHRIWVPVARRLVEAGHRVVLYDQRGHGDSTRGTAPLSIEILADDLAAVLEARQVEGAVLGGHSMGGMTIMSLATHRPEVLRARARALILVATAAADMGAGPAQALRAAEALIASPRLSQLLHSRNGHLFIRGVFGTEALPAYVDLTRTLFADCDPAVRSGFLSAMSAMNLLAGIATIEVPTTVVVGTRDRLTPQVRARQIVDAIPGARLVTLEGRGHMLPLEDPDGVADEIIRALKG